MKRFCKNCGKEAQPGHNVCVHCGTPLIAENSAKNKSETNSAEQQSGNSPDQPSRQQHSKKTSPKKPISKRNKMIWGSAAGIIVLIVAFSVWANWYQSPENTQKRFTKAVNDNDPAKVQAMMIHADDSHISKQEAQAFIQMMKQEGIELLPSYATVKQNGHFLWLYKAYRVQGKDQFATIQAVDQITYTFGGKKLKPYQQNDNQSIYGPLVPGIYIVKADYAGKYGETRKQKKVTFDQENGDHTEIDLDIPVAKVTFSVTNADQFDTSKSYIKLNDEKISINEDGDSDEIGPMLLDGSQKVQTVVQMPWGDVTSEPQKVTESMFGLNADIITPDQYKQVKDTVKQFSEQYLQALAERNTKPLQKASKEAKSAVTDVLNEMSEDDYYSGKLEEIAIDKSTLRAKENDKKQMTVSLIIALHTMEDYHGISDEADPDENVKITSATLNYDTKAKSWMVDGWKQGDPLSFEATETIRGDNKLYAPSKKTVANAKVQARNAEITDMVDDYTRASVDAINYRDFSLMSDYITANGPRRKEAEGYIDHVDANDIYETLLDSKVEKIEETSNNTWKVTIKESFEIEKGRDSSSKKTYRTIIIVKKADDAYLVDKLVETNPI